MDIGLIFRLLEDMESWLDITKKLRSEGSLEKTMEHLSETLRKHPDNPSVHYQIAWTHDALGKESDAVPAYEKAIALGLKGEELEGAYLGLGSTYRCLGDYQNSNRIFSKAISEFPQNGALKAFSAMTQYNLGNTQAGFKILLEELVRSSSDEKIKAYKKALLFYSDKLDQKFE